MAAALRRFLRYRSSAFGVEGEKVNSVLQKIFSSVIRTGNLTVTTASGRKFTLGDGSGKPIAVRFTSIAAELGVALC